MHRRKAVGQESLELPQNKSYFSHEERERPIIAHSINISILLPIMNIIGKTILKFQHCHDVYEQFSEWGKVNVRKIVTVELKSAHHCSLFE